MTRVDRGTMLFWGIKNRWWPWPGLAGCKCIATGLEVQNRFRVFGRFLFSLLLLLFLLLLLLLSLSLMLLSSPALLFFHSVCLSFTISLTHSFQVWLFISGYVIFYLMHSGLFGHLREFGLIGIQPMY